MSAFVRNCSRKEVLLAIGFLVLLLTGFFTIYGILAAKKKAVPLQPVVYERIPVSDGGIPLLAEYRSGNMSLMKSGDISSHTVRIYEDGLCRLSVELAIWNDNETLKTALSEIEEQAYTEFMLSPEDISTLTAYLENAGLEMLPPDVGHQGADGYSAYLTVYLDQRTFRSGGYLADEVRFNEVTGKMWSYVSKEFSALRRETEEKVEEATARAYVN